jgi:general secretion pathway protein J
MARHQHGFSLVEVIVALSLTSLLLASLYSAFGVVGRTNVTASSMQRYTQDRRLALDALRTLIANAVPLTEQHRDRAQVLFEGDRSSLRFVTHLPAHAGGGGLQFVEIRAEDELRGKRRRALTLKFRPAWPTVPFDTPSTDENWSSELVLDDIERVDLEYFGSDDDRTAPSWRVSWQAAEGLPKLVRLSVTADEAWPDLVVPLRAEVSESMPYWHRDMDRLQ